jgi:predicted ATPase
LWAASFEVDDVKQLLRSSPVVTLTGTAGCGKTRLARYVASEVREQYSDGVYLVELAPLKDPQLIVHSLCDALQLNVQPHVSLMKTVKVALLAKQTLIVVDNREYLVQGCQSLIHELLERTSVIILTTSPEALKILGEQRYPVEPMLVPSLYLSADDRLRLTRCASPSAAHSRRIL